MKLTPALLHTRSTPPYSRSTRSAHTIHCLRSVTSSASGSTTPPFAASELAADSSASRRTSVITTFIPASRHARAIPSPMPPAPPVMKLTLSRRCSMASLLRFCVQPHRDAAQTRLRLPVALHDARVVARDDVFRPAGERFHPLPARHHFHDVGNDRKRSAARHVGQVMCGIRGEHDPTYAGIDAYHLQAMRVATDVVDADTGGALGIAVVKLHLRAIHEPHHCEHGADDES